MQKLDEFKNFLLPKLAPLHMYAQIGEHVGENKKKIFSVMLFNKLPRRLMRKIPKTYFGTKVVTRVLGNNNVVSNKVLDDTSVKVDKEVL